ncbi:hypothetical protein ACJX0J_026170, partial [Zea mays]
VVALPATENMKAVGLHRSEVAGLEKKLDEEIFVRFMLTLTFVCFVFHDREIVVRTIFDPEALAVSLLQHPFHNS